MAVVAAGLAIAIATATGSFGGGEDMPVFTEPVVLGTVEETVLANGVLEPSSIVSVGAQVSGQLKTLHVTLGQRVKEGELIAEIDSTVQTNALRIAEAGLANVKAQRNARGIQLRQADQAYDRLRTLNEKRAASTAEFETATAAFLTLKAEVEALDAQIAQSSVEVENARANLGYTKVRAPMDGVVVAVVTKAGQTLNANQAVPTIVVLAQLDVMRVKVQISEADIARVKQGQEVRFTIMGDTHNPIAGVLQQIEPAPVSIVTDSANASMGTQAAPAAVYFNGLFETPNKEGRLRPMMTAVVTIVAGRATNVPVVAWSALTQRDEQGRYRVQVRSASGEITERFVTIGVTDRIKAEVRDGLAVGEDVIIPADGAVSSVDDMVMM